MLRSSPQQVLEPHRHFQQERTLQYPKLIPAFQIHQIECKVCQSFCSLAKANLSAPPLSRTSSASTATAMQSRNLLQTSPRPVKAQLHRLSISPPTRAPATLKTKNVSSSDGAESSSSDSSSESEPAQSRLTRRPRFPSNKLGRSEDADDDDEGPAFLPFASAAETPSSHDPSATLRGDPRNIARRQASKKSTEVIQQSQTSDSSNSSTAPARIPPRREISHPQRPSGPLSPRRTAELAGKNPMGRGKSSGREGSDGTPSMGSSFSDLDGIYHNFQPTT